MIVFDVETTGLDPFANSIASIGAFDTFNGSTFYREIQVPSWAEISKEALRVNGFTQEELYSSDRSSMTNVLDEFMVWSDRSEERVLAGWNVHFDVGFLKAAFDRYNIKWPFGFRYIDIHGVVLMDIIVKNPGRYYQMLTVTGLSKLSLNQALGFYGLDPEPNPHNALTGAQASAAVLLSYIQKTRERLK